MRTIPVIAGTTLCVLSQLSAAPAPRDDTEREARWQADLDYFARALPAEQKDFYQLFPRDRFEFSVAELKRAVPQLSDAEIILELDRLVASLGIAHTKVSIESGIGAQVFHHYPIQMRWFPGGLRVVGAAAEHRDAVGCRVSRVGSLTPEQAEAKVAPYIATENTNHLHALSPACLALAELMQHEKIADAAGRLQLTCLQADGKALTFSLAPRSHGESRRKLVSATDVFHVPAMFSRKQPGAYYWYEYLPDTRTLYIQYNKCHDAPGNPFAEFTKNLFADADSRSVQRVIVDLRYNGGGDSKVVRPLVDGLKARPALSQPGHLYALIGPRTFSSGLWAAMSFHRSLHAILVGEPVGNKPNHYGDARSFVLPNSQIKVSYSVKHFRMLPNGDPPSLYPDVTVPNAYEDFIAGRDRVLETALHLPLR